MFTLNTFLCGDKGEMKLYNANVPWQLLSWINYTRSILTDGFPATKHWQLLCWVNNTLFSYSATIDVELSRLFILILLVLKVPRIYVWFNLCYTCSSLQIFMMTSLLGERYLCILEIGLCDNYLQDPLVSSIPLLLLACILPLPGLL